ncbi:hypothetical protein FB446DRAFT_2166 [Lentinula raphanica]|nr:hypothetical protein FB446DRAFT_2166 [Lentinula raphanica]
MKKTLRCHFYDSQGNPRTLRRNGKPFPDASGQGKACKCRHVFAHPEDPEWSSLPPVPAPSFLARTPTPPPPRRPPPSTPPLPSTPTIPLTPPRPPPKKLPPVDKRRPRQMPTVAKTGVDDFEKSLSNLIQLKSEYESLAKQHRKVQEILDDPAFPSLPERTLSRAQLVSRRDNLEQKMKDAYARYQNWDGRALGKPIAASPVGPEMSALNDLLQQLQLKLTEAESLKKEVEANIQNSSAIQTHGDADGDISMTDATPSSSSLKRKRFSPPLPNAPPLNEKHLSLLQSMLSRITDEVDSLESTVAAQEEAAKEAIRSFLNDKSASPDIIVDEAHQEVEHLNTSLSDLASMTTQLINENHNLDVENQKLLKEKDEQEAELRKLIGELEVLQREQEADESELASLSSSLATYLEKQRSPSPSSFLSEGIEANLEAQITTLVRRAIKPHIEKLRSDLARDIDSYEEGMSNTLPPIFGSTSQAAGSILNATSEK